MVEVVASGLDLDLFPFLLDVREVLLGRDGGADKNIVLVGLSRWTLLGSKLFPGLLHVLHFVGKPAVPPLAPSLEVEVATLGNFVDCVRWYGGRSRFPRLLNHIKIIIDRQINIMGYTPIFYVFIDELARKSPVFDPQKVPKLPHFSTN